MTATAISVALARGGGVALWTNGGAGWEECCRALSAALDDPSRAVRDTAAAALAELAACPISPDLGLSAALDQEKRPAKKQQLERVAAGAFHAALVAPFVDGAVHGRRVRSSVCTCARPFLAPWPFAPRSFRRSAHPALAVATITCLAARAQSHSQHEEHPVPHGRTPAPPSHAPGFRTRRPSRPGASSTQTASWTWRSNWSTASRRSARPPRRPSWQRQRRGCSRSPSSARASQVGWVKVGVCVRRSYPCLLASDRAQTSSWPLFSICITCAVNTRLPWQMPKRQIRPLFTHPTRQPVRQPARCRTRRRACPTSCGSASSGTSRNRPKGSFSSAWRPPPPARSRRRWSSPRSRGWARCSRRWGRCRRRQRPLWSRCAYWGADCAAPMEAAGSPQPSPQLAPPTPLVFRSSPGAQQQNHRALGRGPQHGGRRPGSARARRAAADGQAAWGVP